MEDTSTNPVLDMGWQRIGKEDAESKYNSALTAAGEDAAAKVKQALVDAGIDTDSKLKSYSTTTEMNSAIKLAADNITATVSKTYVTNATLESVLSDTLETANNNVTERLKSYSTTTEMNSAIKQSADSITSTVSLSLIHIY